VKNAEIQQAMFETGLVEITPTPEKGKPCVVYTWPMWHGFDRGGDILLIEPVGMAKVMRHALGHCHGLAHPKDGTSDEWITAPAPARNAPVATAPPPPKPRRDVAPSSARCIGGCGY
jgi:hypothetical protein